MSQFRETYEELRLYYQCQMCDYVQQYAFITKHDETITKEEALKTVLESMPCRWCREEKLKFREKRLVYRIRDK